MVPKEIPKDDLAMPVPAKMRDPHTGTAGELNPFASFNDSCAVQLFFACNSSLLRIHEVPIVLCTPFWFDKLHSITQITIVLMLMVT